MGEILHQLNESQILIKLSELIHQIEKIVHPPVWLDIKKAIQYSSLSNSTLKRAIRRGNLKASKVSGKILIKSDWLDQYLIGK